ncbi:hypothetical protein L567_1350 [Bordetella pertussis STO1-CHLA-0006]|nr:hypothetical protein L567_1350 [Bordetella pertussis STO1-CHLA-0006]
MGLRSHLPELPTPSRCHEILATPLQLASTPPRHRARCTHLQTQPGRIQPIDSSQLAGRNRGRGNTGQTRTLRRPLDKRSEIAI